MLMEIVHSHPDGCGKMSSTEPEDIVTLNVGGILYTTTKFTLQKYPDSMLGTLISGKFSTNLDRHGNIFIDRDGHVFKHILNFLRTSTLCLPPEFTEMDLLLAEADYYQIVPLVQLVKLQNVSQHSKGSTHCMEIIEVRTGSTATIPTCNSRIKQVLYGRKDAVLSLPPTLVGEDVMEKLMCKDKTDHVEVELYGHAIRMNLGELLRSRGWDKVASHLSSSSCFDNKSGSVVIEHSYRDCWNITLSEGELFDIDPNHKTNTDSGSDDFSSEENIVDIGFASMWD